MSLQEETSVSHGAAGSATTLAGAVVEQLWTERPRQIQLASLHSETGPPRMLDDQLIENRFVVSRRRTGFGDCLWSLAAAWQYAQRTGRMLAVDWRGSCYLDQPFANAFPVFFEPIKDIAGVSVICDDQINEFSFPGPFFPDWWNKPSIDCLYRPDEQVFRERDELSQLFQAQGDVGAKTVVCDACLMWRCDEGAERQIFRSVKPRSEIQSRIETIYQESFAGHSVIGVHVRHGNGEDIMDHAPYWADPELAMRQVCTAIDKAKTLGHPKPVRIFLSTDSAQVVAYLSGMFADLITVPKRFRSHQTGPLHTPELGVDGGISAILEMYLLGRCDTVIRFPPTSAFTRYARLFVPRVIEFDVNDPSRLILIEGVSKGL